MVAAEKLQVDLDALAGSAAQVTAHGEDLATAHLSSDNRIAAAQAGWVGDSAAALHSRSTTWLATSHRLLTRVGEHALDLINDAIEFAAMERDNVQTLTAKPSDAQGSTGTGHI
jgi:uncharacterized protein YukE